MVYRLCGIGSSAISLFMYIPSDIRQSLKIDTRSSCTQKKHANRVLLLFFSQSIVLFVSARRRRAYFYPRAAKPCVKSPGPAQQETTQSKHTCLQVNNFTNILQPGRGAGTGRREEEGGNETRGSKGPQGNRDIRIHPFPCLHTNKQFYKHSAAWPEPRPRTPHQRYRAPIRALRTEPKVRLQQPNSPNRITQEGEQSLAIEAHIHTTNHRTKRTPRKPTSNQNPDTHSVVPKNPNLKNMNHLNRTLAPAWHRKY